MTNQSLPLPPTQVSPALANLVNAGWLHPAPTKAPRRLVMSVEAPPGTGKTHVGLAGPISPIIMLDIDTGAEGVIEKFSTSKEIYREQFLLPPKPSTPEDMKDALWVAYKNGSETVWEDLKAKLRGYYEALDAHGSGLIIIDTESEMYELVRAAKFGKLMEIPENAYGRIIYPEYRVPMRWAYDYSRVSTIYTQKLVAGFRGGAAYTKGWGDLNFHAQIALRAYVQMKEDGTAYFQAQCIKSRHNPNLLNRWYGGDEWTFANMMEQVHGPAKD